MNTTSSVISSSTGSTWQRGSFGIEGQIGLDAAPREAPSPNVMARRMLLSAQERHMSFPSHLSLLCVLALPVAACSHQANTASRTPDDTLRDGTPGGDHTGSDPSKLRNGVDDNATEEPGSGPEMTPRPGYGGERRIRRRRRQVARRIRPALLRAALLALGASAGTSELPEVLA
jgi:hypothetical protein